MKRTFLVILCAVFAVTATFAQGKPVIKFEKTTHDFGQVSEEDGKVTYKFAFVNEGNAPLVITQVTASCGCTTPEWTKEPVAPRGKGSISVTYTTTGRPGAISRTVTVHTNQSDNSTVVLSIKGNVSAQSLTPEQKYPLQIGDLRLKSLVSNYGNITIKDKRQHILEIYNAGKTPLSLRYTDLPKYITIKTDPASVPANTEAQLIITFDAPLAKSYGKYAGYFGVIANNNTTATNNRIAYSATVIDDFSAVNRATAPKIGIGTAYFNFGPFSDPKSQKTQILKISNSGQSDLLIRTISCNDPSVTVSIPKTVVKKDEIVDVKVTVQPNKIKEVSNAILTVVTNDPVSTVRDLRVTLRP